MKDIWYLIYLSDEKRLIEVISNRKRISESLEVRKNLELVEQEIVRLAEDIIESLILAQDERWRRA